jgi:hypothetical protein
MKILLTASFDRGLFCNGLQQNIVFLAELIKDIGCTPIIAINHKMEECVDPPKDIIIMEHKEMLDMGGVDYIVQTGWVVPNSLIDRLKQKNPQCRNIHVHYGNRLLADIEQSKLPDNSCIPPYKADEVWVSPHYEFSFEYYKTYYRTDKVCEMPYIWSPKYADIHNDIWKKAGKSCDYKPGQKKNIAILEPNLNMTKNCIPSIFIVEEAYRANPEIINNLTVYCTDKLRDNNYFKSLMWELDIVQARKVSFSGRKKFSNIFANHSNVVVSHQLLNALNYTYLEALHFNIPLVHNSEFIKGAGYYYPDYETKKGGKALYEALTFHDKNLEGYKASAKIVLDKYSPNNPMVKEKYKKMFS